jgi:hypothetical protein
MADVLVAASFGFYVAAVQEESGRSRVFEAYLSPPPEVDGKYVALIHRGLAFMGLDNVVLEWNDPADLHGSNSFPTLGERFKLVNQSFYTLRF